MLLYQTDPLPLPSDRIFLPLTTDKTWFTGLPQPVNVDNQPEHYKSTIDPYAFALANDLGGLEMNVVKYVTRWKKKNGVEDLKKARNTLDRLIEFAEQNPWAV